MLPVGAVHAKHTKRLTRVITLQKMFSRRRKNVTDYPLGIGFGEDVGIDVLQCLGVFEFFFQVMLRDVLQTVVRNRNRQYACQSRFVGHIATIPFRLKSPIQTAQTI